MDGNVTAVFVGLSADERWDTLTGYALADAARRARTPSLENRRELVLDRVAEFFGPRGAAAVACEDEVVGHFRD